MRHSRRSIGARALASSVVVLAFALTSCSRPPGAPSQEPPKAAGTGPITCSNSHTTTVKVGLPTRGLVLATYYAAQALGTFKDNGIEVKDLDVGSGNIPALLAGSEDIAVTNLTQVFALRDQERPVKAFASLAADNTTEIAISTEAWNRAGLTEQSDGTARAKALKNLKVATSSPGAGVDNTLLAIMKGSGLKESDVKRVAFEDGKTMLAAFEQGRVDALAWSAPTTTSAVVSGKGKMLFNLAKGDFPAIADTQYAVLAATESWLAEHRQTAGCVVLSLQQAYDRMVKDPDKVKELIRSLTGLSTIDDKTWNQAFADTYYVIKKSTPTLEADRVENMYKLQGVVKPLKQPASESYDNSIAEAVLR